MTGILVWDKCNNNCLMCSAYLGMLSNNEFNSQRIFERLNEIVKKKGELENIGLTGGEPTLNKDLFEIIKYAREKFPETEITLLSNGRLFAYEDYTKKLANLKINKIKVAIPLHGHTAEIHDYITQTNSSFFQTLRGVKNLLKYNFPVEIRVVINKANFKYLPQISNLISKFKKVLYVAFIAMEIEGKAYVNRDIMAVNHSEFIPYLENSIEFLENKNVNVRLYHFPLCTLKPKFWKYMWNTLPKEELKFVSFCYECEARRWCMGIHESYVKNLGTSEFRPIKYYFAVEENTNKRNPIKDFIDLRNFEIKSYFNKSYGRLSSSLSDIIAVKRGIKPIARLTCRSTEEYREIKKLLKGESIFSVHSDYKILSGSNPNFKFNDSRNGIVNYYSPKNGTIYLYISKDRKMLNKAKSIDPEITLKREDSTYKRAEEFGSLLGYPRCCIRKFILRNRNSPKPTDFSSYILDDKKDFRLNNFFHNGSNYYLSFHYPCSLHCKKSIKYNNEILEAIEEEEPKYALMIKKYLKLPLMVWFSVRKMDSDRWPDLFDNRRIVLFYGKMKKNSVDRKSVV